MFLTKSLLVSGYRPLSIDLRARISLDWYSSPAILVVLRHVELVIPDLTGGSGVRNSCHSTDSHYCIRPAYGRYRVLVAEIDPFGRVTCSISYVEDDGIHNVAKLVDEIHR